MSNITIDRISSLMELRKLEEIWNDILSGSGSDNPFLTFEWVLSWWEIFGERRDLFVLLAREDEKIVGIAPFMSHRSFTPGYRIKGIEFIGVPDADYHDFIILRKREEIIMAFLLFILKTTSYPIVRLSEVSEDSPNLASLNQVLDRITALSKKQDKTFCYYIPLDTTQTWENEFKRFKRRIRQDVTRRMKRFQKKGELVFTHIKADDLSANLPLLYNYHIRRWDKKKKGSKFNNPDYKRFLQIVGERLMSKGWLNFMRLDCNGAPVAIHYGFSYRGRYYSYITVYDHAFRQYSPGKITFYFLIREAHRQGLSLFDFQRGVESYKTHWTELYKKNFEILIFPKTMTGILCYFWFDWIKPVLRASLGAFTNETLTRPRPHK